MPPRKKIQPKKKGKEPKKIPMSFQTSIPMFFDAGKGSVPSIPVGQKLKENVVKVGTKLFKGMGPSQARVKKDIPATITSGAYSKMETGAKMTAKTVSKLLESEDDDEVQILEVISAPLISAPFSTSIDTPTSFTTTVASGPSEAINIDEENKVPERQVLQNINGSRATVLAPSSAPTMNLVLNVENDQENEGLGQNSLDSEVFNIMEMMCRVSEEDKPKILEKMPKFEIQKMALPDRSTALPVFVSEGTKVFGKVGHRDIELRVLPEGTKNFPVRLLWAAPVRHVGLGFRKTGSYVVGYMKYTDPSVAALSILCSVRTCIWNFDAKSDACAIREKIATGAYFCWSEAERIELYAEDIFSAQNLKACIRNTHNGEGAHKNAQSRITLARYSEIIDGAWFDAKAKMDMLPDIQHPDYSLFTCPVAGERFDTPSQNDLTCGKCSKVLSSPSTLERHVATVHEGMKGEDFAKLRKKKTASRLMISKLKKEQAKTAKKSWDAAFKKPKKGSKQKN